MATTRRTAAPPAGAARPVRGSPLDVPAQYVKGVGPARAEQLARLGLRTVEDLLLHRPHRYEDRSRLAAIAALTPGEKATTAGSVVAVSERRHGTYQFHAGISDSTGVLQATWFGRRYLRRVIRRGMDLIVHGKVERAGGLRMVVDEFEILSGDEEDRLHTGRIVPIHPATEGLSPRVLRTVIHQALAGYLDGVPELLPDGVRRRYGLMERREALRGLHFPTVWGEADEARRRLAFDELLVLQLGILQRRRALEQVKKGYRYDSRSGLLDRFIGGLPFALTAAQRRVLADVQSDLQGPHPMHRLLQGDVGSGKTVVAAAALAVCVGGGHQGVLMAPTEILAEQHYLTLRRLMALLPVNIALVTGSAGRREREALRTGLRDGTVDIAIGTHALLESGVVFDRLGLVVVDEQHKFGVTQRTALAQKGSHPDVLVMTATPIPRTLTMTLYGDLDVSVIDELPPGRGRVNTYVRGPEKRPEVYAWVKEKVREGRQAYVVCPLIEESEKLQAEAAVGLAARLRRDVFTGVSVGLLHGRLRPEDKDAAMEQFRRGELKVLVATSVIEVGIDVPQATVMVIEDADRFGLAQLHQLRGRIGRGPDTSYCVLLATASTEAAQERLGVLAETRDGFVIAQRDLELRGPGEVLGTRQHGLPDLKMADLIADAALLDAARGDAQRLVVDDPELDRPEHRELRSEVVRRFTERRAAAPAG